jgi:hypothetical protein
METICHAELISASEIPLISPSSKGEVLEKIPAGSGLQPEPAMRICLKKLEIFSKVEAGRKIQTGAYLPYVRI